MLLKEELAHIGSQYNGILKHIFTEIKCSKDFFHLKFPPLQCHSLISQMSNSLKRVRLSLNRTNPPELIGIICKFRPLTHLSLTSKISHTQDKRSALAETNPLSLSLQPCGLSVRAESESEPLVATALLNSPPKALMELSGAN